MLLAVQFLQANESWQNNQSTWEETAVTSRECSLFFCVNEYEAAVQESILHEKVVSSWKKRNRPSYEGHQRQIQQFFEYANQTLDMDGAWTNGLSDLQIAITAENYAYRAKKLSQIAYLSPTALLRPGGTFTLRWEAQDPPGLLAGLGETNNITMTFENVALSLTKWMRDREFSSSSAARGNATITIVITHVQWEFLGFPAATLAAGIIFAALSIWETQQLRGRALKDSALATLAHAPTGDFKAKLQVAAATGKIADIGKASGVMMQYRDGLGQLELTGEENGTRLA
ncbi:hypothetical protein LRP88_04319 [Fusarium phalaenopsidis]